MVEPMSKRTTKGPEQIGEAARRLLQELDERLGRPADATSAEIGRGEVSGAFTDSHPAPEPGETVGTIDRATVTPRQLESRMVRGRLPRSVVYVSFSGAVLIAANDAGSAHSRITSGSVSMTDSR